MSEANEFPQGYVTIKTLIARSTAPRQTIHYYLRKGLLPPPTRTSRTSALYSPVTAELIGLIRTLQNRQRFTLDEIATLFQQASYDPVRIAARVNENGSSPEAGAEALRPGPRRDFLTAGELATALGPPCSEEWVRAVAKEGLAGAVWREGRELFPLTVLDSARAIWDGIRMGLRIEDFKAWRVMSEAHAEKEVIPFQHRLAEMPPAPAARVAELFNVFERFARARRKVAMSAHLVRNSLRRQSLFVGSDSKYLFPSETLLARMGLNREIDRLLRLLDRDRDNREALIGLARAYNLRSDWVHLERVARELLRVDPDNVMALAQLAQAMRYQVRPDEAVSLLEQALQKHSHPLLKVRLARALVSRARESGDIRQFAAALEEYQRLADEASRESQGDRALYRLIRVILALEAMSLGGPMGLRRLSVDEIQQLYDEFQNIKDGRMAVLPKISLARGRIFLTYALYLFRQQQGHPDAEKLRRELRKADPHGVLAARAGKGERSTKVAKTTKVRRRSK